MPRLLGMPLAADLEATAGACHAVMPGGRVLLGCGFWDNSVRCQRTGDVVGKYTYVGDSLPRQAVKLRLGGPSQHLDVISVYYMKPNFRK